MASEESKSSSFRGVDPRTIKVPTKTSARDGPNKTVPDPVNKEGEAPTAKGTLPTSRSPPLWTSIRALEPTSFPDPSRNGSTQVIATIPNLKYLLDSYGIIVRYNVIYKKLAITIPAQTGAPDNADNAAFATITSLASLNGMPTGQLMLYLDAIGNSNPLNPVADWISSKTWDGVDRLEALYRTLVHEEDYPEHMKKLLMHRWLLSAGAAALWPGGFRCRGVLTIQGPQSLGKTAWVKALVPDPILSETAIKLDHHLDVSNKDTVLTAISHWIVEIGELDSSFRRDIARLKGFLTSDQDKVRRPYGRTDASYPRRTVFCASVNESNFLIDSTGNSRWWTIPVTKVNYEHKIDMQQVFAQIAIELRNGVPWWLSPEEEATLDQLNRKHSSVSAIAERVTEALDLNRHEDPGLQPMSATEMLIEIGIESPTNPQCKECVAVLRDLLGKPKRIRGQNKWRIPLRNGGSSVHSSLGRDKKY